MRPGTWISAGVAAAAVLAAGLLYRDNRRLERDLARTRRVAADRPDPWKHTLTTPDAPGDGGAARARLPLPLPRPAAPASAVAARSDAPAESRLERRLRRQRELADLLGREADESEADYKARVLPLLEMALAKPRDQVDEARKAAEVAAHVTDDQHQQLDTAFQDVYTDVIDYTNSAISDRQLTPYDRNVKGMLQYAGGLGAILEGAEGKIGKILTPDQMRAMYDTGFEWGEYLGVRAPWEQLHPPPPRPGT